MVFCGHLGSCVSPQGTDAFAFGVPAGVEGRKSCVSARGLAGLPPLFQLLVPSLRVSCATYPYMTSPYRGMSIGVHRDLLLVLLAYCHLLFCAV
jgi:hypothetical protein